MGSVGRSVGIQSASAHFGLILTALKVEHGSLNVLSILFFPNKLTNGTVELWAFTPPLCPRTAVSSIINFWSKVCYTFLFMLKVVSGNENLIMGTWKVMEKFWKFVHEHVQEQGRRLGLHNLPGIKQIITLIYYRLGFECALQNVQV